MKIFLPIVLLLICILSADAQNQIPAGMQYQAIARDNDGIIRAKEELTVKAELLVIDPEEQIVYEELHHVTSGDFGLMTITIGEGKNASGKLSELPWERHIWIRISIKDEKSEAFQLVTTSKLYSVPYAFYAASAGSIKESSEDAGMDGANRGPTDQTSYYWSLEGNFNSHKRNGQPAVLGTTDKKDLTFITANQPRMIIDYLGIVSLLSGLNLSGDLNVDGTTTLNDSLTVTNMSPTHLTGTLTVDKATTLNSTLDVTNMSATHLTGTLDVDQTLNVDGPTTLNNNLTVTNASSAHLTGSLTVDKEATFNDDLTVNNMAPAHLTGTLDIDKTLNVDGATTLNNTLDVTNGQPTGLSGTLRVDQATTLNASLTVQNMAPSHLTGDLDIDQTMNVDGPATMNSTLQVLGGSATSLTGTLTVGGVTTLQDDLTVANMAPTHLTGSLDVDGAFTAAGDISLDGPLEVNGMNPSTLTGTLDVGQLATMKAGLHVSGNGTLGPNGEHVAFFDNTAGGDGDGIAIRINNNNTNAQNNFVTFYKGGNGIAGRIEGYVINDILSPPIPTEDEIWSAVCIVIADYNPLTIFWTQFANQFNLVGTLWNGATIPAFDIPDFPGLALPDFPGLGMPDFPGLAIPDFPGLTLPDFPGVSIPDIPNIEVEGVEVFPGLTLPDVPSFGIPDVPSFGIPDVPAFAIPDIPAFAIPDIPAFEIPDVPEIDLSGDLFEWPTIPTFSDILIAEGVCPDEDLFAVPGGYVYRLIEWGVQNDMQNMISFNPIDLASKVVTWGVTKAVKSGGVTYGSQGADYAEYLPKLHASEQFMGGEIVGVHGGKISKVTEGADQILAISTKPLVLGNQPEEGDEHNFAKVGFLGQVPVFVEGPVSLGDYIIPSGRNDGVGKAVRPNELTAELLPLIFGKAWSDTPYETTVVINVSIGLRPTEISEVLRQREENLNALQRQIDEQAYIHNQLKADVDLLKAHFNRNAQTTVPRS